MDSSGLAHNPLLWPGSVIGVKIEGKTDPAQAEGTRQLMLDASERRVAERRQSWFRVMCTKVIGAI